MATTILIIDNNKMNAELMVYLLNYHGYGSLIASNGEEGIVMARLHKPNLIISEINLPILNGYEVAKILKNDSELKKIPLLAVTAYAMLGDRSKVRSSGFDAYISKPINPSHFIIQVETLLLKEERVNKEVEKPIPLDIFQEAIRTEKRGLVVIVNDFSGSRELMQNLLSTIGFEVVVLDNASGGR